MEKSAGAALCSGIYFVCFPSFLVTYINALFTVRAYEHDQ